MSKVHAWRLNRATLAQEAELDQTWARTFMDELNEPGSGSFSIQNDDPDRAAIAWQDPVLFKLDAVNAWTMVVEAFEQNTHTQDEEHGQFQVVTGRGLLSEWDRASMYPPYGPGRRPFPDQREFGWTDPTYDWSVHPAAVVTPASTFEGRPEGWPDDTAEWIWDRDSTAGAPVGPVFFWKAWTSTGDARVALWIAADDRFRAYIDGVPILQDEAGSYRGTAQHAEFDLSAGDHVLAVAANNENALAAGLLVALMTMDGSGNITASGIVSDTTWHQLAYPVPEPPGVTVGFAIRTFLEEAQDRGELDGWVLDFDDDEDSDGNAWDGYHTFPVPVGLDGLSFLRQLCEGYCEVAASPTQRLLRAWNLGGRGTVTSVAIEPGTNVGNEVTGNIVAQAHTGQGKVINVLLVRYSGGYLVVEHAGSIGTHGRQCGTLRLEGVTDPAEAQRIGEKLLAVQAFARVSTTVTTDPEDVGDIPFVSYHVGDWVDAEDEVAAVISQRVRSITVFEDEQGLAGYVHELRDKQLESEDLYQRMLKRANLGALGGRSDSANFVDANPVPMLTAPVEQPWPFSILDGTPGGTLSPVYTFRSSARNIKIRVQASGPGAIDTELAPRHNGANYGSNIILPAADTFVEVPEGEQFHAGDELQIDLITNGGHTGLVVEVITSR